jgi:hypothetical protein
MDLLDRYLQAVKKHLPWQRQDDIIAELKANLESQLEDKEAELGRPLTPAEAEEWLKQMGSPIQVAAAYQPQRYLIGPAIFPTYWYVLRLATFWCLIIYAIVSTVRILSGGIANGADVLDAVLHVPGALITTVAWVTLIFAVIEFGITHSKTKWVPLVPPSVAWTPCILPPVEKDPITGKKRRSFAQAVAEVVIGFFLLIWLLLIPGHPWVLLGPGALYLQVSPYHLGPVFIQFFWWVVALNLFQLGWRCLDLARGTWQRARHAQKNVMQVLGLIPLVLLLTVPNHASVVLKHPALDQVRYGATLDAINLGVYRMALVIFAIALIQSIVDIVKLGISAYRKRAGAR